MQGWIANKCLDEMQLPFALWTAQAARELIHKKFGKTLGLSTMQLYLKRWGFSAQKTFDAGDAARSAKDRGLAGAGLSVNRGAGKARQGGDLLERRDGHLQPGSDRQRLRAKRTDADPDADGTEVFDEYDRRR